MLERGYWETGVSVEVCRADGSRRRGMVTGLPMEET